MQIKLNTLQLKLTEKFSFESKNEKEVGKIIEGFFLTFTDEFMEKIVISSSKPFVEFDNKWVDVLVDLKFSEFQGRKGFKLKVDGIAPANTPPVSSK